MVEMDALASRRLGIIWWGLAIRVPLCTCPRYAGLHARPWGCHELPHKPLVWGGGGHDPSGVPRAFCWILEKAASDHQAKGTGTYIPCNTLCNKTHNPPPTHTPPLIHHRRPSILAHAMLLVTTLCLASVVALPLLPFLAQHRMAKGKEKELDPFTRFWMGFMTEHRGGIMMMVVLPLSFLFELWFEGRDWLYRTFHVAPKLHDVRVRHVQEQVKRWNAAGLRDQKTMCTARAAWLTMSTRTAIFKKDCSKIDCGQLRDILHVDKEKLFVRTEPLWTCAT